MPFLALVSSPLRGGLRWGHQFNLLFFDLTLTLSCKERELFFILKINTEQGSIANKGDD